MCRLRNDIRRITLSIPWIGIELAQANPYKVAYESVCEAHGFAQAGGVAGAVKSIWVLRQMV